MLAIEPLCCQRIKLLVYFIALQRIFFHFEADEKRRIDFKQPKLQ